MHVHMSSSKTAAPPSLNVMTVESGSFSKLTESASGCSSSELFTSPLFELLIKYVALSDEVASMVAAKGALAYLLSDISGSVVLLSEM